MTIAQPLQEQHIIYRHACKETINGTAWRLANQCTVCSVGRHAGKA